MATEGLEERIAALEARLDAQEMKRRTLRDQFIALQLVVVQLLPLISICSADEVDAAIADAKAAAENALSLAGFDAAETASVLESMTALRDDLVGEAKPLEASAWH